MLLLTQMLRLDEYDSIEKDKTQQRR